MYTGVEITAMHQCEPLINPLTRRTSFWVVGLHNPFVDLVILFVEILDQLPDSVSGIPLNGHRARAAFLPDRLIEVLGRRSGMDRQRNFHRTQPPEQEIERTQSPYAHGRPVPRRRVSDPRTFRTTTVSMY